MEKRSITGKDILRMDGLLPPTKRLPVCDAVTSSEKKKEKKWSLGGILKRISAIRDYDSSSNEEEMVYCRRQPRPRTVFNRKSHNVVLHPVKSNHHLDKNSSTNSIATNLVDTSSLQKDSTLSRSSDGSLDGLNKKTRKNKLKARIEAKRDRICADSSSEEETRKSFNSLPRFQNETGVQNVQKNSSSNRKSRTARTERYIKRLTRDESHRLPENLNSLTNKRSSLDFTDEKQLFDRDADIPIQPSVQSQRSITHPNSYTFPVQKSVESLRQATASSYQTKSSNDLTKHPTNQYITDLNQNNTYAKPNILQSDRNYINHNRSNYVSNSPMTNSEYARPYNYLRNDQSSLCARSLCPPEPPPRDPRCKVFTYGCNSFPFNGRYRVSKYDDTTYAKVNHVPEVTRDHLEGLRSYESNNEIRSCGSTKRCPRRPLSLTVPPTQSCNLTECTNNRHNSTGRHIDETIAHETEAMKCQRRNVRNDQLNSRFTDYNVEVHEKKALTTGIHNRSNNSSLFIHNRTSNSPSRKSPLKQTVPEYSNNTSSIKTERSKKKLAEMNEQDALERKRSSKNLEEALSELETIYNSLRLGDEDLLDRAERRSMEEFSLRRGKPDDTVPLTSVDSPDRSKDDMAYRRMHPKERPTSLSEAIGQSTLSNISYLMASPILLRKNTVFDYPYLSATNYPVHKDEPDVTRDDVVYRSFHYANNTLKVADPQPPFGIPLGPVTTATESDYLHTTPTKPDYPRSPYIPQCEPDIVTDDLAYRNLRKDANTTKNTVESKTGVAKDQETTFGVRKKRAVRSLSANLYGLIDHDRIHLRREPSLQEIKDEISESLIDIKSLPVRKDSYRRVVSDGELSDYDTRWRTESSLRSSKTDINGNHPSSNVHRQKLRVYVSPSTQVQRIDKKGDNSNAENCMTSTDILSKALNNEFWQDCLQSKSNKSSNTDTESDFTAYSRLCQDLVNLIEGPDVEPVKETIHANLEQSAKVDDLNENNKSNESSVLRIQSLGSHYSKHNEKGKESTDNGDIERLTESIIDPKNEDPEKTDDNAFDFYLRVADENVKLIAEAFSSVADRLRDSRLSQKNSLTSRRSEIETDSTAPNTSTCSSVTCSPDDVNDELSTSSRTTDISHVVPKEDATIHLEEDHEKVESNETKDNSNADPELDLTKAVHDLQLAAASLCEHEKEIEELKALLRKDAPPSNVPNVEDKESLVSSDKESESPLLESEEKELECEQEDTIVSTDVTMRTDERDPDCEGESIKCENICGPHSIGIVRSSGMRVSYVTNLITVIITTYCLVLLACFIALLLATVAAS
ncbi:uncharacterized protein LOC128874137 isoform X1 [Hylaeus volcanicus]|uniref:uncharacterized protein LOC128874137 isoform X1 n=1 Tax=Hylaeus volcanicus TaxID=313075 RepID=UPI0023B79327|nr:uncharacterized protein LOC128874137 isoform X1 [Hylaeus volcanicus]XP_053974480.1 uncharacterized protein LOC128874137 isoform X1 [Hylaeus volcanicus]